MRALLSVVSFVAAIALSSVITGGSYADSSADVVAKGKELTENRRKGNCLACHIIGDGEMPGNQGPPLIFMKQRFPDKGKLRATVWDATAANPNSMMPPFGRHGILSDDEIDKIIEYIYTL